MDNWIGTGQIVASGIRAIAALLLVYVIYKPDRVRRCPVPIKEGRDVRPRRNR